MLEQPLLDARLTAYTHTAHLSLSREVHGVGRIASPHTPTFSSLSSGYEQGCGLERCVVVWCP